MDELRCVRPVLRPPADVSREMGLMKLGRLPKKQRPKTGNCRCDTIYSFVYKKHAKTKRPVKSGKHMSFGQCYGMSKC